MLEGQGKPWSQAGQEEVWLARRRRGRAGGGEAWQEEVGPGRRGWGWAGGGGAGKEEAGQGRWRWGRAGGRAAVQDGDKPPASTPWPDR